jgi:hypothetical protein
LHHSKKYTLPAEIRLHRDENFLQHAKIEPQCFAGQIKRAKGSTRHYQAMLWWPRIDVHKKGYTRTAVAPYDDFTTISLKKKDPVAKIRILLMKDEDWILLNLQSLENPEKPFKSKIHTPFSL